MLVNLNYVLDLAKKGNFAVGLFNTCSIEEARGVISAAEETNSPVIIGTAEVLLPFCPLENLIDTLIPMAKRAKVPVVVHFDHGLTYERCLQALRGGFTSIMYDCSMLSYDENINNLKEMVKIAHAFGATVEGELGHVGNVGDGAKPEDFYTKPEEAKEFVEKTGVDALAIAVGTAHGTYKTTPKLDFERIVAIREAIPNTPLVLHGGSGLSNEDFRKSIDCGIRKINIFTDLDKAAASASYQAYLNGKNALTQMMPDIVESVKQAVIKKMLIFKNQGE